MSHDFDRDVKKTGRRKALAFFGTRLLAALLIIYFAIAAYGHLTCARYSTCSCNDCDCVSQP
ncbi:MAG: hypothetical protein V4641_05445 [Pseudomonadota bacterium]